MKCPHCGQEHPDSFKFCPNTAKPIETQLKACTNKNCPDCGKFLLPIDSKFCPTCGSSVIGKSDSSEVFLSFFDIVLGETNIYDVDSDEYTKSKGALGETITVNTKVNENNVILIARQSDRKIFSVMIQNEKNLNFPDSWISLGVNPCNVMLSMEKILGRNNFVWTELRNADETIGIANKRISDDLYICIIVVENGVSILKIPEKLYEDLYEDLKKVGNIATKKSETTLAENNSGSDDLNKVGGRYRWQTDSYLKKIEEDKKAREQREREKELQEIERLEEKKKRREEEERKAMIEKWRRTINLPWQLD